MKIGELFFEIGAKSGKFQAELNSAKAGTLAFGAGVVGAGYALEKMWSGSAKTGTMLYTLSQLSGIAASKLDQMSLAASKLNASISTEDASNQLAKFGSEFAKMQQRGQAAPVQELLAQFAGGAISMEGLTPVQWLDSMSAALKRNGVDALHTAMIIQSIGFSPSMVDFFREDANERNRLGAKLAFTNEESKNLKEAEASISSIWLSLTRIKDKAMAGIAPNLAGIAKDLSGAAENVEGENSGKDVLNGFVVTGQGIIALGKTVVNGMAWLTAAASPAKMDIKQEAMDAAGDKIKEAWGGVGNNLIQNTYSPSKSSGASGNKSAFLSGLESQYGLPDGWLSAIEKAESGGNVNAVSPKGARGAFQFMPDTAAQYGVDTGNYESSAVGAAKMFGDLSKKYGGDKRKMAAAYNWGQGNVDRLGLDKAPAETRDYMDKIAPQVNMTNNFNITGDNANAIANTVVDKQQQTIKQASSAFIGNY